MAGPDGALEHRAQRARVDGHADRAGRVDLVDRRVEDDVGALLGQRGEVGVPGARVAVEVLAGAELGRVDEDRDDDGGRALAGGADQRPVALVQRAHGRAPARPGRAGRRAAGGGRRPSRRRRARCDGGHREPAGSSSRAAAQQVEQRGALVPLEPAGGQRALGGAPGHGDVGGDRLRRPLGEGLQVVADGADVAAADRPGQPAVAAAQAVVQRGGEQRRRARGPGRRRPAVRSRSAASATRVTRWLAPVTRAAW